MFGMESDDMDPEKIRQVLSLIPYDDYISAGEISKKTGLSGHEVSGIIKSALVGEYVERPIKSNHCNVYRRLKIRGGKEKWRGGPMTLLRT